MNWTEDGLAAEGFHGFVTFADLDETAIPDVPGLYVVLRRASGRPTFARTSAGGWHKKKDPARPVQVLQSKWLDDVAVLYIGKAGARSAGMQGLRRRIGELRRFGSGIPVGHWGGRSLWQLPASQDLVVAWKPTSGRARDAEKLLIAEFKSDHAGRLPFANLVS